MTDRLKIILVDDERNFCRVLGKEIARMGHEVASAHSGETALDRMRTERFDIAIVDVKMPGIGGMETLHRIRVGHPGTDVLMLTGDGTIEGAVEAVKLGAFDYLTKPARLEEIETKLDHIATERALRRHVALVGESDAIQATRDLIRRVASTDSTVLIQGESGSGKELVARSVHATGPRHDRPFVAVNCANLQDTLLESELFGHVKGAFTGAVDDSEGLVTTADKGSLFLDEISEMQPSNQTKLLRFMETGEARKIGSTETFRVDVRVICATNRNLKEEVSEGRFREDLFHRINIFIIDVPPLRDRTEDIPSLARHFLDTVQVHGRAVSDIDPQVIAKMQAYGWPGNVRELRNLIERMKVLSEGSTLYLDDWRGAMPDTAPESGRDPVGGTLARAERAEILEALRVTGGNKTRAAKILGISVRTLYNKLRDYQIDLDTRKR